MEQFCEIILNLDQWFRRRCHLKIFLINKLSEALVAILFSEANHLCNFGRGCYEEQFCEFISNLGQWFRRRCRLKDFLSDPLVTLLSNGAEPFMHF